MVNPLSEINRMRRGMAGVDEEVSNIIGKGLTKRLTKKIKKFSTKIGQVKLGLVDLVDEKILNEKEIKELVAHLDSAALILSKMESKVNKELEG